MNSVYAASDSGDRLQLVLIILGILVGGAVLLFVGSWVVESLSLFFREDWKPSLVVGTICAAVGFFIAGFGSVGLVLAAIVGGYVVGAVLVFVWHVVFD